MPMMPDKLSNLLMQQENPYSGGPASSGDQVSWEQDAQAQKQRRARRAPNDTMPFRPEFRSPTGIPQGPGPQDIQRQARIMDLLNRMLQRQPGLPITGGWDINRPSGSPMPRIGGGSTMTPPPGSGYDDRGMGYRY